MVTEVERLLRIEPIPNEDLEARVERLEGIIARLVSDQAIGNALKGPFRLPGHAKTAAFQ